MEASAVMDKSALEWFFDHFIENNSSKMEEEVKEKPGGELFVSSLPDESRQKDANTDGTSLNYSSQNSTAAVELPGGSSTLKLDTFSVGRSVTPKPGIVPQIQNIISTVKLGCHLDLHFIAGKAWNVEYRPKTYNALIMRIHEPRTTAVIYQSGNLVCTGAKSEEQSRLAARRYARIIQKLGFPVCFLNFRIQNLVASCKTFPLSLDRLALEECSRVTPGITATIFSSGKMSLSGAKKAAEIYEAFNTIYPILSRFRRQ